MTETIEQLEKMEALGFKLLGPIFKDTLAYVQIQRKKRELQSSATVVTESADNRYRVVTLTTNCHNMDVDRQSIDDRW